MEFRPTIVQLFWLALACQLIAANPISNNWMNEKRLLKSRYGRNEEYDGDYRARTDSPYKGPFYYAQKWNHDSQSEVPFRFEQRYWVRDSHYALGGPIFLIILEMADDLKTIFDERSMFVSMATRHKGMLVALELRYHGKSHPGDLDRLTENELDVVMTTRQMLEDLAAFAKSGMKNYDFTPYAAPWVLVGGSISGSLVNWARLRYPNLFWAGYASSAMVQAKLDFWEFFDSTGKKIPATCANDIKRVIYYFDHEIANRRESKLKETLGLSQIEHIDDVAWIMAHDVAFWLEVDYINRPSANNRFDRLCDVLALDSKGARVPADKRTLDQLLTAWKVWNLKIHGNETDDTWTSHDRDASRFKDLKMSDWRRWRWLQCTEYGWFYTAPPKSMDPIVSQQLTLKRELRMCSYYFPETYSKPTFMGPEISKTNMEYGGWGSKRAKRVFFANGGRDPYLGASVMAEDSGYVPLEGSPVVLKKDGHHMSDFYNEVGGKMSDIQEAEQRFITRWLAEWKELH